MLNNQLLNMNDRQMEKFFSEVKIQMFIKK